MLCKTQRLSNHDPFAWFCRRHFLLVEALLAAASVAVEFAVWLLQYGGSVVVECPLRENRATLYGTTASIFGSLLGFAITATSIVLGFPRPIGPQ